MGKHDRQRYSNPDDAPINYEQTSDKTESTLEVERSTPKVETVQTNNGLKKEEKPKITENRVDESLLTNYVKVKILGRSPYSGTHLFSPLKIADLILRNTEQMYHVVTSEKTANLVIKIIRNESSRMVNQVSPVIRERAITVFLNDLKKIKF